MERSGGPAVRDATRLIAPLQQGVLAWTDADRVLPAEGSLLLAALERTLEGLTGENPLAARAGIEAFIGRVEALIEAGLLDGADGNCSLHAAAALAALLPGADGSDG